MVKPHVTSVDVARMANVSQSAVSRAFSEGASVSPAMRARVLAAAERLGYRPNALARAVISGRSGLIAVVAAYLDNLFYPGVLERISRAVQARGYQVMLMMTERGEQDQVIQQLRQYRVEGIILLSATLSSALARDCAQFGTPVVLFNRYVANSPAFSVVSDNFDGGRQVADFLVELGHKRIAFIAGDENSSTSRDREAGLLAGLRACGQELAARACGHYEFEGARRAARDLLSRRRRPDAVFVANDQMAFAVMDVARDELGLRAPEDVSIVGYDDAPQASWAAYALTTVAQPVDEMLEATMSALFSPASGRLRQNRSIVLPAKLVRRATARPR